MPRWTDRTVPRRIVFADVDGTVLRGSSLIDFLLFDARRRGVGAAGEELVASVRAAVAAGAPRHRTAPLLYSWWAGRPVGEVFEAARDWVGARVRADDLVHRAVLDEIEGHRRAGAEVVFVSASFDAPLTALSEVLGANAFRCTPMEVSERVYTGATGALMLGERKAEVVRGWPVPAGARRVGYGDHVSDLPMLAAVDEPVAVTDGGDEALVTAARARGWRVLRVVAVEANRSNS